MKSRWKSTAIAGVGIAAIGLTSCGGSPSGAADGDTITIGMVVDLSGVGSIYGIPGRNVAELAVEEINAAGGVDGRELVLEVADGAGAPDSTRTAAMRLLESENVVALFAPVDSASRDAALPVAEDMGIPFFYPTLTEGHACHPHMFSTGNTPGQQLQETIPVVQEIEAGDRWFLIGNDYIYPQTALESATEFIEEAGGTVVGEEYMPLGSTDYQAVISKIRAADPDLILSVVVGADSVAFERQAYDAGLGAEVIPRLVISYDDNTMDALGPDVANGMYVAMGYDMDLDTSTNNAFVEAYWDKFGDDAPYVTAYSVYVYITIKAWAEAVASGGSAELDKLAESLIGQTNKSPAGDMTILENRYAQESIHLIQYGPGGGKEFIETFPDVVPAEDCVVS